MCRHVDSPLIHRELRRFHYRVFWWSDDGSSWQFATTGDFAGRATPAD